LQERPTRREGSQKDHTVKKGGAQGKVEKGCPHVRQISITIAPEKGGGFKGEDYTWKKEKEKERYRIFEGNRIYISRTKKEGQRNSYT